MSIMYADWYLNYFYSHWNSKIGGNTRCRILVSLRKAYNSKRYNDHTACDLKMRKNSFQKTVSIAVLRKMYFSNCLKRYFMWASKPFLQYMGFSAKLTCFQSIFISSISNFNLLKFEGEWKHGYCYLILFFNTYFRKRM